MSNWECHYEQAAFEARAEVDRLAARLTEAEQERDKALVYLTLECGRMCPSCGAPRDSAA